VVYRPEREAQVLRRLKDLNQGPLSGEAIAKLFREVMSACLALEKPLAIAFLGPHGTYTEMAAVKQFGHAAETIACPSIDEAFRMVSAGNCDYLVAPVENSTGGAVERTLDLLVQTDLQICGEVQLRIHQCLLRKEAMTSPPRKIYSHQQSLIQCHEWLNLHYPSVERVAVASNAEAARLAGLDAEVAAIAGEAAIHHYGLIALARHIEDEPNNTTRFLVLGAQSVPPSGQDKTSLIVATQNRAGAVYALLAPFAAAGISMSKFESRPSRQGLWEYLFFIDIEGHQEDARIVAVLNEMKAQAAFVKVLGSYPIAVL
jgi:chorismate mutase/prephenate dehydratase